MKIKSFTAINAENPTVEIIPTKQICFLHGNGSDTMMDLMRETLGDLHPHTRLNSYHNDHFVLHSDVEIDGKDYKVCYIRNAEGGENLIAVNFDEYSINYSRADTYEYWEKCSELNQTQSNVLVGTASAKDLQDTSPIFIYDYFDRLDEAIDITPILDELSSLGREVFISVCPGYPIEKMMHPNVQVINMKAWYGEN